MVLRTALLALVVGCSAPSSGEVADGGDDVAQHTTEWDRQSWRGSVPIGGSIFFDTLQQISFIGTLESRVPATNLSVIVDLSQSELALPTPTAVNSALLLAIYAFANNIKVYRSVWFFEPGVAPVNVATLAFPPYTIAADIQPPTGAAQGGTNTNVFLMQGFGDVSQGWGIDASLVAANIIPTTPAQITNVFLGAIAHGVEVPSPQ
jgi:hypothetical protein